MYKVIIELVRSIVRLNKMFEFSSSYPSQHWLILIVKKPLPCKEYIMPIIRMNMNKALCLHLRYR